MAEFASSEAGKLGGKATAEKMTREERRDRAKKAAAARWGKDLPHASHEGTMRLGNTEISCAVLEGGQRLITQSGFMVALGRARQAKGRKYYDGDVNLPAFLTAKNLKPFVDKGLSVTSSQVEFITLKGQKAYGYSAELLPKVCDVFLDAESAGVLAHNQKHIAEKVKILVRGLAHVGVVALVDEATGFQAERDRDALAKILEAFVAKELRKWVKTFPPEYYQEMCRLKNVEYPPPTKNFPQYFGTLTNGIVYDRIAPGLKHALQQKNPSDGKGNRKHRHHQHLTKAAGHPALREHLSAVTALMKASSDWEGFKELLDRALPKQAQVPSPLFDPAS